MDTIEKIFNSEFSIFKQLKNYLIGNSLKIGHWKLEIKRSASFTLIELLIVMAIIGILTGVLVPMVERSLAQNRLSDDAEIMRAKIEQVRLLAGSTRSDDEATNSIETSKDEVAYYAIYIPGSDVISALDAQSKAHFYAIVRLSDPFTRNNIGQNICNAETAVNNAINGTGDCLVEKINLDKKTKFTEFSFYNKRHRLIAFRAPTQKLEEIYCPEYCGNPNSGSPDYRLNSAPLFNQPPGNNGTYFKLSYRTKIATVNLMPYTGVIKVTYAN